PHQHLAHGHGTDGRQFFRAHFLGTWLLWVGPSIGQGREAGIVLGFFWFVGFDPHLTSPLPGGGTHRVCGAIWESPVLLLPLLQGEAGWGCFACLDLRRSTPT